MLRTLFAFHLRFCGPGRGSLGAKSQKVSKKVSKKSPGAGSQKSKKNVSKKFRTVKHKKEQFQTFLAFSDLFREFFRTFGTRPGKFFRDFFGDFLAFDPETPCPPQEEPKGSFRTVFSTESDSVVFCYSVVNLLRIVIHYWKYSKSVQNAMIQYIFSSESLRIVSSLQIVNSLRVLFLVCWGPLGTAGTENRNRSNCSTPNRNRTEPNRGLPDEQVQSLGHGSQGAFWRGGEEERRIQYHPQKNLSKWNSQNIFACHVTKIFYRNYPWPSFFPCFFDFPAFFSFSDFPCFFVRFSSLFPGF